MKSLSQIRQSVITEASGGKEAYQKFFNSMLKKFGVKSAAELEGDKKKEFFDAIDAGWEGDNEEPEPGDKKESVDENCGADHSGKGVCPECGKQLSEGKLDGIAKALTSMAGKPEYKKVAKNLKSLAMRASEGDKKAAKQIATQLDKLIMKVDKKSAAKLMKLADLTLTYEDVEEGLVKGRGFPGIKADKKKKKNKRVHGANKNIAYDYDRDKRKEDVEEAVSVDMRTRGFKSAVKRNLLRKEKATAKKKSEIDEIIDATNKKLRGESMVASGSDATGDVAGKDMPLLKKKKVLKKFKDA